VRNQVDLLRSVRSARRCPFVIPANVHHTHTHTHTHTKTDLTRLSAVTTNGSISAGTKVRLNPQPDVTNKAFSNFYYAFCTSNFRQIDTIKSTSTSNIRATLIDYLLIYLRIYGLYNNLVSRTCFIVWKVEWLENNRLEMK
jgi:hypothetical protein